MSTRNIPISIAIPVGIGLLVALTQGAVALKRQASHIRWHRRQDALRFDRELEELLSQVEDDEF